MKRDQTLLQILLGTYPEDETLLTALCSSYAYFFLYSFRLQHRRYAERLAS